MNGHTQGNKSRSRKYADSSKPIRVGRAMHVYTLIVNSSFSFAIVIGLTFPPPPSPSFLFLIIDLKQEPCRFFYLYKCEYGEEKCKYSHTFPPDLAKEFFEQQEKEREERIAREQLQLQQLQQQEGDRAEQQFIGTPLYEFNLGEKQAIFGNAEGDVIGAADMPPLIASSIEEIPDEGRQVVIAEVAHPEESLPIVSEESGDGHPEGIPAPKTPPLQAPPVLSEKEERLKELQRAFLSTILSNPTEEQEQWDPIEMDDGEHEGEKKHEAQVDSNEGTTEAAGGGSSKPIPLALPAMSIKFSRSPLGGGPPKEPPQKKAADLLSNLGL